jgi:hypothetical protein
VQKIDQHDARRRSPRGGAWLPLALGGVFALVGLSILSASWLPVWNDARHRRLLASEGILTLGMVLTKSREKAGSVTVLGYTEELVDYSVRYRFTTHGGRKVESTAKVAPEEWGILEERGPIKVRYLPDHPETNHVPDQVNQRVSTLLIFTAIGGGLAVVGGVILLSTLRKDRTLR